MQTPDRPARSLFATPITLPGSAPKAKYRTAQNSPLLFDLFFVLWGPPTVYRFKTIPRSEFGNFRQIRVNKPTEGKIYIYTEKILYKHTIAEGYFPLFL